MQFKFKIQPYQTNAVDAVVRVFEGQPKIENSLYTFDKGNISNDKKGLFDDIEVVNGFGNAEIRLSEENILENVKNTQYLNNIKESDKLIGRYRAENKYLCHCSLDIEMDTGTGKTYVYTKTMFELNKVYGWSKFIIVVPSIAIREGVKKSVEQTEQHFFEHYKKKARVFIYNSKNLNDIDRFSTDNGINIMIINIQAFNTRGAAGRLIYEELDSFNSRRPIDVVNANRPILIMDEPQKMGGKATQETLKNFRPLFILNYSATHKEVHNPIYVLDALEAYNQKLVKKILVDAIEVKNLPGTGSYMFLEEIRVSKNNPPVARLNLEVKHSSGIKRETRSIKSNDNLYAVAKLEQYKDFVVSDINAISNSVIFTNSFEIKLGEAVCDATEANMRRIQIRETIRSHFFMEKKLFKKGIKVLSLFFIDEVAKYRKYDEAGNEINSEYGEIFEEEYKNIFNENRDLFDKEYMEYLNSIEASKTHKGYFSIDKKTGHKIDSVVSRGAESSDDISAYDLILKNKERLLSFEEPVRFIFSHSALSEGWDNPNVFQICTLKHSNSTIRKRQEVGRGMRLCVDKEGNRMDYQSLGSDFHNINALTVIANESYASFVSELQKQIKEVLYDRPTEVTESFFWKKEVAYKLPDGNYERHELTMHEAVTIYDYCTSNNYIDKAGHITEKYHEDTASGKLEKLPELLEPYSDFIHKHLQGVFDKKTFESMIDKANNPKIDEKAGKLNENFKKDDFKKLWGLINHKYVYTVNYNSDELVEKAIEKLCNDEFRVTKLQFTRTFGGQKELMKQDEIASGTGFEDGKTKTEIVERPAETNTKYDLIGQIARNTILTRKSVAKILKGITQQKFNLYAINPEDFIKKASKVINNVKAELIVNNISYKETSDTYSEEIFEVKLENNFSKAIQTNKHISDYIFKGSQLDSKIEEDFVKSLENADEVEVYAKLPREYKIPTPVGDYSPDWAICFKKDALNIKHVYFIAETKGSTEASDLRPVEQAKINCAKKLYNQMSNSEIWYHEVKDFKEMMDILGGER